MKKLLKTLLVFIMVAVIASCSDEEATVAPVKEDNIKTDTKISIEQARQDLLGLLSDLDSERSRSYGKLPRTIKEAHSFKLGGNESRSEETPNYYVFNFDNNQGYAIMSGDERMPSLIALTDSGSFNENDSIDNPGLEIFYERLDTTGKIVITPVEPGGTGCINWGDSTYFQYMPWVTKVYRPGGYCFVKWGQGKPYNTFTKTNAGEEAVTGCVATAMAQLMSVYRYPLYYGGYNFYWNEMTASQFGFICSTNAQDQIAHLMEQLGKPYNLAVTYGTEESGATPDNINRTFKAFGYSNGGTIEDYSLGTVVDEINLGHPLLMYGKSFKKSNRHHMWLIHGLMKRTRIVETHDLKTKKLLSTTTETEWYPQINWGWDGYHDGYYLDRVFNANLSPSFNDNTTSSRSSEQELNYQYNLKLISGIRK